MIVSTTLTTALDDVSLDTGAGAPTVGISPASAETERTHVKTATVRNLLIDVSPLRVISCKAFYMELNSTSSQDSLSFLQMLCTREHSGGDSLSLLL